MIFYFIYCLSVHKNALMRLWYTVDCRILIFFNERFMFCVVFFPSFLGYFFLSCTLYSDFIWLSRGRFDLFSSVVLMLCAVFLTAFRLPTSFWTKGSFRLCSFTLYARSSLWLRWLPLTFSGVQINSERALTLRGRAIHRIYSCVLRTRACARSEFRFRNH